jgi:hypothetical protein
LGIIYQKITWRLMPIFIAVVMLNQIDRNNLSYAALTMNRDLGFSPRQYGLGSALFFISFFVMMVSWVITCKGGGGRGVCGWGCACVTKVEGWGWAVLIWERLGGCLGKADGNCCHDGLHDGHFYV